jgi:hypothetical protein
VEVNMGGERVNVNVNTYIIVFTDICTEKDPYINIDMEIGREDFWIGEFGRISGIAFELNSWNRFESANACKPKTKELNRAKKSVS